MMFVVLNRVLLLDIVAGLLVGGHLCNFFPAARGEDARWQNIA